MPVFLSKLYNLSCKTVEEHFEAGLWASFRSQHMHTVVVQLFENPLHVWIIYLTFLFRSNININLGRIRRFYVITLYEYFDKEET